MVLLERPPSPDWNLADLWEVIAARLPDAPAQRQGARAGTWSELNRRANGVASELLGRGCGEQDKVAQYLYNCPEYLESMFGAFKAGLATVNTNYRYRVDELTYLWDNADVRAVVFHGEFAEQCERVRERLPRIRSWIWVDDGTGPRPGWATAYDDVAAAGSDANVSASWGRSPDHLLLLYTGGTTGLPKGVMWRQGDVCGLLDAKGERRLPSPRDHAALDGHFVRPGPRNVPAAPLMHGTGLFNAITSLLRAGSIVCLEGRRFSAPELLDTIDRQQVTSASIVGDAFAKPILRELDAAPGRWDISSLRVLVSSGAMWSADTKQGLLRHNPRLIMVDTLGSSEAIGVGSSTTTNDSTSDTARFVAGPGTRVLGDDGRFVRPGSMEIGRLAQRGRMPIGYYKDAERTDRTFVVVDGERYSVPGDYASIDEDGSIVLLGRGSQCINTGGEKVFPEEVEEALKAHPDVADAAVVGLPDEKWGQVVMALVEPERGRTIDESVLREHVKERLAAYKTPKGIVEVPSIGRAANGKLDYPALTEVLRAQLAGDA